MKWEYVVTVNKGRFDESQHEYARKRDALACAAGALSLGKSVTVERFVVYPRMG